MISLLSLLTWCPLAQAVSGEAMPLVPSGGAEFQPYIFWAYGLVCPFLLGFTLWTVGQLRRVGTQLDEVRRRVEDAVPGEDQG